MKAPTIPPTMALISAVLWGIWADDTLEIVITALLEMVVVVLAGEVSVEVSVVVLARVPCWGIT